MLRHLTLLLLAAAGAHAVLEVKGAYQPSAPFDVRVWPNYTSPGFVFPELADDEWGLSELQEKPEIGVAFGGGGFRAAIMALGWARGLQEVRARGTPLLRGLPLLRGTPLLHNTRMMRHRGAPAHSSG